MTAPGPRGWQPAAFVDHVMDVVGELNRRHDRRLVLRACVDLPDDWTAADSGIVPRVAWRSPHGRPAEALGLARQCPVTELRWLNDAPHPDDLQAMQAWMAQHQLLADALLACSFPEPRGGEIVVPLQLWLPRLWLTTLADGRVEVSLVLLGEDDPDAVLAEVRGLLAAIQPHKRSVAPLQLADRAEPEHMAAIAQLVTAMRAGEAQKVVWSRTLAVSGAWPRSTLAGRMRAARPEAWTVDVQLANGQNFLCATPELLVACQGDEVATMALAGTGSRAQLTAEDARLGDEHGRVRDFVLQRLTALGVEAPNVQTDIANAGPLAHRRTQIRGHRGPNVDALTVALTLHPTPALLGLPRKEALALLTRSEPPRGLYGGCLGRLACDGSGTGEVVVLLRGVMATPEGWQARAGAGLVPGSVPSDEVAEIAQKLAAIGQSLAAEAP